MTRAVAHRGASAHAPENTMEAFRLAVEMGADAIELDVHVTADGELAVIHDETLERTCARPGAVAALTMAEIREADAGAAFAGPHGATPFRGRGLTVPTLPEVLAWLPDGVRLVVEIKARAATDAVVEALAGSTARDRTFVISFDERAIDRARELDSRVHTGYLLVPGQSVEPALVWATERGHAAVLPFDPDLGLDPSESLRLARAYGREVGCYVVNDPDRMQILAAAGLWGFVTDVPDVARAALDALP